MVRKEYEVFENVAHFIKIYKSPKYSKQILIAAQNDNVNTSMNV